MMIIPLYFQNIFVYFTFTPPPAPPVPVPPAYHLTGKIIVFSYNEFLGPSPRMNESCQLLFLAGQLPPPGTSVNIIFTTPSGSQQQGNDSLAFIGSIPVVGVHGTGFPAGEYIGYTFADYELNAKGTWTVQFTTANFVSNTVPFRVV